MSRTDDGAVRHHNAFAVAGLPDRTSRPDFPTRFPIRLVRSRPSC